MSGKTQKHRYSSCLTCGTPDHRKYKQPMVAKQTKGITYNSKFNFWVAFHCFNQKDIQDIQVYCSTKEEAESLLLS
ncbi:MAG: hypothetical protein AABY22_00415 [Nanoarchaeota archaeon]